MLDRLSNPHNFKTFARYAMPILAVASAGFFLWGLYLALYVSPPDRLQGDTVRIMYVHVPAASIALFAYAFIAMASLIAFVWRHPLADMTARAAAWPGLVFTAINLVTGSLWGKPMWGTWWEWDARLTSMLVQLFLFAGYIAIWHLIEPRQRAAKLARIVALVGLANIPIIKFSVEWWNTLHQPATFSAPGAPGLDQVFALPLIVMSLAFVCLFGWLVFAGTLTLLNRLQIERLEKRQYEGARKPARPELEDL